MDLFEMKLASSFRIWASYLNHIPNLRYYPFFVIMYMKNLFYPYLIKKFHYLIEF